MSKYVIKNQSKEKKVLLYSNKKKYTFSPKNYYKSTKILLLDDSMIESVLKEKVISKYNKIVKLIYYILASNPDDDEGAMLALDEIEKLKNIILNKYLKYLPKDFCNKYFNKLIILEKKLKEFKFNQMMMNLNEEVKEDGKTR